MPTPPRHPDLIYDVGMHLGEDTGFYLRKGFRVVGFEADPQHVQLCRGRFATEIADGQLTLVEGAIVAESALAAGQQRVAFYRNETLSVWGTVNVEWADRNARQGATSSLIEVAAVDFTAALEAHGIPHYLKIDIEGSDLVCLEALRRFEARPDYLSLESSKTSYASIRQEIELLSELGYDRFQAVEQSELPIMQSPPFPPREGGYDARQFERGSSGLFGAELGGTWKSKRQILDLYRAIRLGYFLVGDEGILSRRTLRGSSRLQSWARRLVHRFTRAAVPGWFDTHARHCSVLTSGEPL